MYAIGIGCVWFASRKARDFADPFDNYDPFAFLDEIKVALESLDSISNLSISRPRDSVATRAASLKKHLERQNFFPIYSNVDISFDILIPKRTQEQYSFHNARFMENVELFHVKIAYDSGLPILFVYYPVSGGRESVHRYSPSHAIVYVRKYLADRLSDNSQVEFSMLGPSPFHADFFLISGEPPLEASVDDYAIEDMTIHRGYRTLVFYSEESEIVDDFARQTEPIFSAFYESIRETNYSDVLYSAIMKGVNELLEGKHGLIGRFSYWIKSKRRIDKLYDLFLRMKEQKISSTLLSKLHNNDEILDNSVIFERGYKNAPRHA